MNLSPEMFEQMAKMLPDEPEEEEPKPELPPPPTFTKEITREGSGDEVPELAARVVVKVDEEQVKFILGSKGARVPVPVSHALLTMKRGEVASVFSAEADKATDKPWTVELLEFENVIMVTPDAGVVKKIIKPPNPNHPMAGMSPEFESVTHIVWKGIVNDNVFEEREFDYICGELCDIPAIEKAIRTMKTGEVSEFTLSPKYGFGAAGNPEKNIPADSIVKYYIELHRFDVPKSPWRCTSTAETIQEARTRKEQGNAYFRMKEYDLAQTKYTKAQLFIECAEKDSWSPEELSRANEVKLHCSTNLAFVTLRNEEYDKTLVHCNNALDIDPNNLKALYRRGIVYHRTGKFDEAKKDLVKILEIEPGNTDTRKVLVEVNQKLREQEQKEKATYQKMMKTLGGDENTSPIGKPTVTVVAVTDASQVDGVPHVSEDIPPATDEGKAKEATDRIQSEAAPKQKSFIKKLFSWW